MLMIKKGFSATFNGRDYKGKEGTRAIDLPEALESILVKDGIVEEANDKKEENDD